MTDRLRIILRSVNHRASWAISRFAKWPVAHVIGFPKSGTTWVTQLVSAATELPYYRDTIWPVIGPAVLHGHSVPDAGRPKTICVVRDCRDVMVSLYFHRLNEKGMDDPTLQTQDYVRNNLADFIIEEAQRPKSVSVGWGTYYKPIFSGKVKNIPTIKYENLLNDTFGELTPAMEKALIPFDSNKLEEGIKYFSFKAAVNKTKNNREQRFLRKGVAGDWCNYFNKRTARVVHELFGDAMAALGYENDNTWTKQI